MGVMPAPLGYCRTYAKLQGPLTEANYLKAIRAGRTFATGGPMLTLTVAGKDVGAEIRHSIERSDSCCAASSPSTGSNSSATARS